MTPTPRTPSRSSRRPGRPAPTRPTPVTTLTARAPEDLLAVAPVVLGFWPEHSVVLLTLGGAHGFHARIDLPPPAPPAPDPEDLADIAAALVAPTVQHGVQRVVVLIYCEDAALGAAAWRVLVEAFAEAEVPIIEALRVGSECWFPLVGPDAPASHGVPYDVTHHPFLAEAVLDGRVTHRSRRDLAAILEPVAERTDAVEAAAAAFADRPEPERAAEGAWLEVTVARHLAEGTALTDVEAARLLLAVRSVAVRDAALSPVDRGNAREAVRLFTDLLQRTPSGLVAPAAGVLAWSAWLAGDGALAWCAVDRCEEAEPGYRLAALVADALSGALPPSTWVGGFDWREGLVGESG